MNPAPSESNPLQSAIGDTEGLLDSLLEHIPDRIYFKDKQSRFIRVSRAKAERHGIADPREMIGKTDFDLFTSEHAQPAYQDEQQILRTGETITGKVEKETLRDGQVRWALTTKMPLRNSSGDVIGTCGISKDVTALKEMEDALAASNAELGRTLGELKETHEALKKAQGQLIETEKAQTAARLAAGVAHEVRNPLNILNTGIEYFGADPALTGDENAGIVLKEMREAVLRADAVICTLMDSSRGTWLDFGEAEINGLLERALNARAREIEEKKIEVVRAFGEALPPLLLDARKISTVLDGVLSNAIEAMSERGGRLTARTKVEEVGATDAEHDPGGRAGQKLRTGDKIVVVELEDTGAGIPAESLHDIFDPFFTTKKTGSGTGLGLTVCRKIIELHGGSIELVNLEGGGVKARIVLPTAEAGARKAALVE